MTHEQEPLGYEYTALEPHIDAKTMEIHYTKHHKGYVDKLNAAIKGNEELEKMSVKELIAKIDTLPGAVKTAVRNNGGGHLNHTMFWKVLKKDVAFEGEIKKAIEKDFESLDKFKEEFSKAAATRFGSGWAWLVLNGDKLEITSTANQDNPLSENKKPILGLDVWEHAYYLKYQNKRPEYIENFFKIINWEQVNKNLEEARKN